MLREKENHMEIQNLVQETASFNGFVQTIGGTAYSDTAGGFNSSSQWVYPTPTYWYNTYTENKTEKAYGVIRALMRAKVIQVKTLNQFFTAMDEVVKAL